MTTSRRLGVVAGAAAAICADVATFECKAWQECVAANGRVDWAGFPMIVQPKGVWTASWHLSSLKAVLVWRWAGIQSLPIKIKVGHYFLIGNLSAR